jgi:hypothetical protein
MAAGEEPPLRRCPHCGALSRTRFEQCPECGRSLFARRTRFGRRTKVVAAATGIALVAVAVVVFVASTREDASERSARASEERARLIARERARLVRSQAPRTGRPVGLRPPPPGAARAEQIRDRRALIAALERAIAADARGRVRRRELDRPVSAARCGPLSALADTRNEQDDPSRPVGRYDCVATTRVAREGGKVVGRFGYDYVATVDFRRFEWVLCLNHPPPGEAGKALVQVRLSPACLGLPRNAVPVGSGYLAPG